MSVLESGDLKNQAIKVAETEGKLMHHSLVNIGVLQIFIVPSFYRSLKIYVQQARAYHISVRGCQDKNHHLRNQQLPEEQVREEKGEG